MMEEIPQPPAAPVAAPAAPVQPPAAPVAAPAQPPAPVPTLPYLAAQATPVRRRPQTQPVGIEYIEETDGSDVPADAQVALLQEPTPSSDLSDQLLSPDQLPPSGPTVQSLDEPLDTTESEAAAFKPRTSGKTLAAAFACGLIGGAGSVAGTHLYFKSQDPAEVKLEKAESRISALETQLATYRAGKGPSTDAGLTVATDAAVAALSPDNGVSKPVVVATPDTAVKQEAPAAKVDKPAQGKIRIALVGAINLRNALLDDVANSTGTDAVKYSVDISGIEPHLSAADLVVGALDGLPVDDTMLMNRLRGKGGLMKDTSVFSTPTDVLAVLKNAGFDVFSMANRWAGGYGRAGLKQAIDNLAANNLAYAGIRKSYDDPAVALRNIKGKNVCVHSWAYGLLLKHGLTRTVDGQQRSLVNFTRLNQPEKNPEEKKIAALLDELKAPFGTAADAKKCDLSIVSVQWGNMYGKKPAGHLKTYAKQMFAAGADLVVGHMPYYLQSIEDVGGDQDTHLVAYSLGKLLHSKDTNNRMQASAVLLAEFDIATADIKLSYVPTMVDYNGDGTGTASFSVVDLNREVRKCQGKTDGDCKASRESWCFAKNAMMYAQKVDNKLSVDQCP
jgi:poly-gamma-glutamate synthesis protein (capsule biosynthesis protein)